MAPIMKRSSLRARAGRSAFPPPAVAPIMVSAAHNPLKRGYAHDDFGSGWMPSKREKRTLRHNALLAKVQDGGVRKPKQRRPARKLKADIATLVDALPEIARGETQGVGGDGTSTGGGDMKEMRRRRADADGKMAMRSARTRPGAMKRKRKMEMRETERFQRNLARLAGSDGASTTLMTGGRLPGDVPETRPSCHVDRWVALRDFIGGTLERDRAFLAIAKK